MLVFKKITLVLLVAFCCLFVSCHKEDSLKEVDDVCTKIEDPNFMKYCYDNFDVNKDGKVSMQEAAAVKIISCSNRRITSLKGIEYFHTITDLDCINNNLSSLDISKNTQLTGLDCSGNDLRSLNLSKNSLLTILYCNNNNLTSLDISKNSKLNIRPRPMAISE